MMTQMVGRPNTTPIGQDRETLTFKALHFAAVHAQVCRLFCYNRVDATCAGISRML